MHNRKFYISALFIAITFLFSACGSSKVAPPTKVEAPKWIKLQPDDTITTSYGIGIEKDRQTAIKSALNDVISKLGIKVQSSFNYKEIVDGHYSKSISTNSIKTDVAKIRITNYDVEKSHRISFREYAVLVKVDNKKFYNTLVKDIANIEKTINQKLKNSSSMDAISRHNIKTTIKKELDRLISNSLVAHELNKNFNTKKYFDFVTQIKNNYYTQEKSLKFFIHGNKNSKNFMQIIKKHLLENGFNVANTKDNNTVDIDITTNDDISNNKSIVSIKIDIKTSDKKEVVGSNTIVLKERNKNSKSRVYNTAAVHFEQDTLATGITKMLGININ